MIPEYKDDFVTEPDVRSTETNESTFTWHPDYRGRTRDSVVRDLSDAIAMDQRQYNLALSGAEQEEHQALSSIMELEKRWSPYSFDWAESDPNALAVRIADFEFERDRRQEMIPYATYRDEAQSRQNVPPGNGWRASRSDDERRRIANIGAGLILALILVVIVAVIISIL